jgi:hypothetical protein
LESHMHPSMDWSTKIVMCMFCALSYQYHSDVVFWVLKKKNIEPLSF